MRPEALADVTGNLYDLALCGTNCASSTSGPTLLSFSSDGTDEGETCSFQVTACWPPHLAALIFWKTQQHGDRICTGTHWDLRCTDTAESRDSRALGPRESRAKSLESRVSRGRLES